MRPRFSTPLGTRTGCSTTERLWFGVADPSVSSASGAQSLELTAGMGLHAAALTAEEAQRGPPFANLVSKNGTLGAVPRNLYCLPSSLYIRLPSVCRRTGNQVVIAMLFFHGNTTNFPAAVPLSGKMGAEMEGLVFSD